MSNDDRVFWARLDERTVGIADDVSEIKGRLAKMEAMEHRVRTLEAAESRRSWYARTTIGAMIGVAVIAVASFFRA